MSSYIKSNKIAWEDAYEHKQDGFEKDIIKRLETEELPFLDHELKLELSKMDLKGLMVGQFCSNNGRELLSLAKKDIQGGIGFDIAHNMVSFANGIAKKINAPIKFVEINILDIDDTYNDTFDLVIITIGALCWFENLHEFFDVVSKTMKKGGKLIIHEGHPFYNMLATPDEDNFNQKHPNLPVNDYFKKTPWVSNSGMSYMTKAYESKTFTSFSHTFEAVLNALIDSGITITQLKEFDHDIANLFGHLNNQGIPLSYLLKGVKTS